MKLCPTCGEVYPQGAIICRAHGATLRDWRHVTESSGGVTSVELTDVDGAKLEDSASIGLFAQGKHKTGRSPTFGAVDYDGTNPGVNQRILAERYVLGRQIGIGGYGAVFSAIDEHSGDRVAVKLLSPALANDHEAVTRFRREAIAASRVDHPGIVDVSDFHIDLDGTSYIVMEYLDGEDLSETLDDHNQLEPARALSIAAQCAEALAAAHDAHILHRDLKPANIFLTTGSRRRDVVKIIDFGISKITQGEGRFTDLTSASKVVGTPFYMSPEQAQGHDLDGRTDVYSMGVILYRMLTGQRPFNGDSALDILTKHIEAKRVPPSKVEPTLARFPKLDRLVLTAMAAKTRNRYASMRDFRAAILDALSTIDETAAARLDKTQLVSRVAPATADATQPQQQTVQASSGQITRQVNIGKSRMLRWVGAVTATLATATLAWWLTRSATPSADPPSATTPSATAHPDSTKSAKTLSPPKAAPAPAPARPGNAASVTTPTQPSDTKVVNRATKTKQAKQTRQTKQAKRLTKRAPVKTKRRTRRRRPNRRNNGNGNVGIKDW